MGDYCETISDGEATAEEASAGSASSRLAGPRRDIGWATAPMGVRRHGLPARQGIPQGDNAPGKHLVPLRLWTRS